MMRVLDLFAGTGSFSAAFRDRGHDVVTLDRFTLANLMIDVREYRGRRGSYDAILASPPCQAFSVASIPHHWRGGRPGPAVKAGLALVFETFRIVREIRPRFSVMENPRGMLRKVIGLPRETVFYCTFGDSRMKPTDLWGRFPSVARPHRSDCGHAHISRSERGARNNPGTVQSLHGTLARSQMPYELSAALCIGMEAN